MKGNKDGLGVVNLKVTELFRSSYGYQGETSRQVDHLRQKCFILLNTSSS